MKMNNTLLFLVFLMVEIDSIVLLILVGRLLRYLTERIRDIFLGDEK